MRSIYLAALVAFALVSLTPAYGVGSEPAVPYTISAGLDLNSRYVWRGLALSDGAVLQPYAWCGEGPVIFSVWGNLPITDEPNQGEFNELDYTLEYDHQLGPVTLAASLWFLQFVNTPIPNTGEADLVVTYPALVGSADVSLMTGIDFIEQPGAYYGYLGFARSVDLLGTSFGNKLSVGWSNAKFNLPIVGVNEGAVLMLNYAVSARYEWLGNSLEPRLSLSYVPSERIRSSVKDPFIATLGLSLTRSLLP